ncbi:sperm-associated antigen 1 isoform X2 [Agrilus planipennis]|uniref:Sperm-associated antigen 1 isoform X2 n=1 Tax=Agrilus planipennis TaxID=224129 RepID=A0A1W4WJT4_AGRPL|nr:sperm-associated antigen 1 isoform X2 [Agrilus planipennis]
MVELQGKTSYKSDKKVPLSVRYNIPDYYLDFEYVNKCTNGKTLEKILKILRSGEEGYYPQLVQATEERLKLINPSSKLLRVVTPAVSKKDLEKEEVTKLTTDLDDWLKTK